MYRVLFFSLTLFLGACQHKQAAQKNVRDKDLSYSNEAHALIAEMVKTIGTMDGLYAQQDVEYTYIYRTPDSKEEVTTERYIFDGELSWASSTKHELFFFPGQEGEVLQSYDGANTMVKFMGKEVEDEQMMKMGDFMRKTNYYWFAMMFKLMDPGLQYEMLPKALIDGTYYDVVKVSFDDDVGDVQDIYHLYINPETKLVDQFLFTVMDFGMADPKLMKVEYKEINGLLIPAYRKYTDSDWQANILEEDTWVEEISEDIKFNNGFTIEDFKI